MASQSSSTIDHRGTELGMAVASPTVVMTKSVGDGRMILLEALPRIGRPSKHREDLPTVMLSVSDDKNERAED